MIEPFWGEFTGSCAPLEWSINACSYGCAYCFAILNNPHRRENVAETVRFLSDFKNRNTVEAMLLREGYPTVVSNRSDPFAASNAAMALPILRTMAEMDLPVVMQTRGGKDVDEALTFLKPSVWYVSLETFDDEIRQRVTPGAPSIPSRMELVGKLKAAGHRVVLGVNPYCPEWLPEPEKLFEWAKGAGVEGVWIEMLHLSARQKSRLKPWGAKAIGEEVLGRLAKRKHAPVDLGGFEAARKKARAAGLEVYSGFQPVASDFFRPWRETYPVTFPVMQDFVNACWEVKPDEAITFTEFSEFFLPYLPAGVHRIGHYIGATAKDIMRDSKMSNWMSYADVLAIMYSETRCGSCPARIPGFGFAVVQDGGEFVPVLGDDEMPMLVWSPQEDFGDVENNLYSLVDENLKAWWSDDFKGKAEG